MSGPKQLPKVSIVIPTRNRAALLIETLASLCAQTCADWEAVVVDDHSTDDTIARVAAEYGRDERIRVLVREGKTPGAPACRNQGFAAARSEYVIFLDSDDLLAPECVERRLAWIEARPELDFVVFQGLMFNDRPGDMDKLWNRFTDGPDLDRFLEKDVPWQTTGPIWRRGAIDRLKGWDESLICWQDFDLHIRALMQGLKYEKVDTIDYYVRRSPEVGDSIHKKNSTDSHLKTRLGLLRKVTRELRVRGLYNEHTRRLMTYAFLALSREWIYVRNDRRQAIKAWEECREEGVIGQVRFYEGALGILYLEGNRGLTRVFHNYTEYRWRVRR